MAHVRRGRHVVLSVDQLVPHPVFGEEDEVVVGELHARCGRLHVVAPGHRLIVAVSRAPAMPPTETPISTNRPHGQHWRAEISMPERVARGRICRNGERMNRQPVFTAWVLTLVATASLVVAAQAPRFTPVTDETLRSPAPAD